MGTRKHKPHIVHILALSLVLLILSADAAASDWFVRPAGGSYGNEDGSSYQDAWDGLLNVVWGGAGVVAGDTLYICGLHVHNVTNSGNIATQADITPVSGSSGSRITIRGDASSLDASYEDGIVWNAYKMSYDTWTDQGDGAYSIPLPGSSSDAWFFQDIGNPNDDSHTILDPQTSIADVKNNPGSYYSPNYKTSSLLYVHLTDSGDPTGRVYGNYWGYDWKITGLQYITFLNLTFYNPDMWDISSTNHVRWQGCTLAYGYHSLITIYDNSDYIEVIDCELSFAENGIYSISNTNDSASYYLFKDNYIHDIGLLPKIYHGDAHAIGVQGGVEGIIEGNTMIDCGSGIYFYAFENQVLKDTITRNNFVKDTSTVGGATGYGITLSCTSDSFSDKSGNQVYCNIVSNASFGGRFNFEDELLVYNNVFAYCTSGVASDRYYEGQGANLKLRNNIFYNNSSYHINWATNVTSYTIDSDYNLFYPTEGDVFRHQQEGQTITFTDWKAISKERCVFDPHSIVADPLFVDPGNGNFNLIPGSLAIDAGVDVGLAQDYGGNPIPLGSAPDIGAYEAVIDPDNPPPVLEAIGDKSVDENAALTFTVNATDPDSEPITYLAQGLPSGATLDPQTGDFDWTPSYTQAGSYQVRFIASDDNSHDSETITITVSNVNRPPVLGAISDPSVDENNLLNISVSATDPDDQTLTYSVSGLPNGAVFAGQTFTWTPSYDQAGNYELTFIVDDGQDQDSQLVTITVNNVNRAPVFTAIGNKSVWSDDPLTFTIDATDPDGDAVTYSADTVPGGATFITETFDWIPTAAQIGTYDVTFIASDGLLQDSEFITGCRGDTSAFEQPDNSQRYRHRKRY